MPAVLGRHQHELCDVNGNNGIVFGTEDTGYLTITPPLVLAGDQRNSDLDRPQEDGRAMGRDFRGGKSYEFTMGVLTDQFGGDVAAVNREYINDLDTEWNHTKWRRTPRLYAMLRSNESGSLTMRAYGRPRRFEEVVGFLTDSGYTPITATFDLIDDRWYSDVEYMADVTLVPSSEGGIIAPIVAPISTTRTTAAETIMTVGGRLPTWPVIEFNGPVINPSIQIGDDIVIRLITTISDGDSIVFDPRPWKRTTLRTSNGGSAAGAIDPRTPAMRDCQIDPGTYPLYFSGTDVTGTGWCAVRWRTAQPRP